MPIESRPNNPITWPRPGAVYTVQRSDTWETVAQKHKVGVQDLIQHNFATLNPPEINWYLREYVGCIKTYDQKNWCFEGATPGKVFIPPVPGSTPPRDEIGINPPPGPGWVFPAGIKINPEIKFGPKDIGYLRVQVVIGAEGTVKPKDGPAPVLEENAKSKLTFEVKKQIASCLESTLKLGVTLDDLTACIEAVKYGKQGDFVQQLAKLVSFKLTASGRFKYVTVKPSVGCELSTTPAVFEWAAVHEGSVFYDGSPYKYTVGVKVAMKVGLSAMAWREIARRIGVPAVRAFAQELGPAVAAEIGYWAGFVILAVGATVATTALAMWAIDHAQTVGDKVGAGTWYARHYSNAVFEQQYFALPNAYEKDVNRRMIELAGQDLIKDMRDQLIDVPNMDPVPYPRPADFWQPAREALKTYKRYIIAASDGDAGLARERLEQAARQKAWKALGV